MSDNLLTIKYFHPRSDEWTICQCHFVQIEPKFRVINQELPKGLVFKLAEQLIAEGFKVASHKWHKNGWRVVCLTKGVVTKHGSIIQREPIPEDELDAKLTEEHLRKLDLSRNAVKHEPNITYLGQEVPIIFDLFSYSTKRRLTKSELRFEQKYQSKRNKEWARQMYFGNIAA